MRPSLSTTLFRDLDPYEVVRHIAEIGWPAVELVDTHLRTLCEALDLEASAGQFCEVVAEANLTVAQAHLSFGANPANLDEKERRADLTTLKQEIDFCQLAGIPVGVVHPTGTQSPERSAWRHINEVRVESFRELAGYATEKGVRLAVENVGDLPPAHLQRWNSAVAEGSVPGFGRRGFGAELWELLDLLAAVDSSAMGICLDTCHARVQGHDQPALIRELGELLIALHVADSDGEHRHWIPLQGDIDWPPIVAALREVNFGGEFNLELPQWAQGERSIEVRTARARYALEVVGILLQE